MCCSSCILHVWERSYHWYRCVMHAHNIGLLCWRPRKHILQALVHRTTATTDAVTAASSKVSPLFLKGFDLQPNLNDRKIIIFTSTSLTEMPVDPYKESKVILPHNFIDVLVLISIAHLELESENVAIFFFYRKTTLPIFCSITLTSRCFILTQTRDSCLAIDHMFWLYHQALSRLYSERSHLVTVHWHSHLFSQVQAHFLSLTSLIERNSLRLTWTRVLSAMFIRILLCICKDFPHTHSIVCCFLYIIRVTHSSGSILVLLKINGSTGSEEVQMQVMADDNDRYTTFLLAILHKR